MKFTLLSLYATHTEKHKQNRTDTSNYGGVWRMNLEASQPEERQQSLSPPMDRSPGLQSAT